MPTITTVQILVGDPVVPNPPPAGEPATIISDTLIIPFIVSDGT